MDDKPSNDGVSQGRVQLLLQKLRLCESSASVREDICVLERVLQDLIYWHHSRKISPKWSPGTSEHTLEASKTVPSTVRKVKVSIEEVLKLNFKLQDQLKQLQTALLPRIKSTEKLVFVGQRVEEIRGLVVKADETGGRLVVVGPRDIKIRSEGRVHIGDQILAVGQHVLNPSTVGCDSHFLKSDKNSTLPSAPIFDEDSSANLNSCTVVDQKISLRSNSNDDIQLPWKSDNEGGEAITWPSALIDRYEKLIEKAATAVYKEESGNCAQIVVVTLLRQSPHMVLTGDWTEVQIIHLPNNPSVGLGFGIVGGTSTGVVVKTILPGSVADKDGRLRPGDHILMICGISVHGMSSQQVATILRQQDTLVELVVGRPALFFDNSKDTPGCWIMPTRAALCPKSLEEQVEKHTGTAVNKFTHSVFADVHGARTNDEAIVDTVAAPLESATGVENHPGPLQFVATVKSAALCRVHNGVEELHTESVNGSAELGDTQEGDLKRASQEESASEVPSQLVPSLKSNTDPPKTESSCSFRKLQEMALTTFARANWIPGKYKVIEVELCRDPVLGLGITVAGYVHKNEEIGGVFVKSLVPNTSAFYSKKIQLHDLIHEVNGQSLVGLNHSDSVRTLVRSGARAKLKLIRFLPGSPQAECLKMLQEQEAATQINDAQNTLPDVVADWKRRLGSDFEVVSVDLIPDKCDDGGLGISLEGTVDVVNGTQLCPHHYIDSLRPGGPAASSNALRSGDELLQANEMVLYGESHITVRQALSKAVSTSQRVRLTVARKAQFINVFMPRPEQSLPIAYPLLAASDDRLVKAKSETCITSSDTTAAMLEQVSRRLRSRSLHLLTGLAIWKCVPIIVQLEKDSRGLGFSVVDYRDSLHPGESVIVVRSLVPGGLAQADGRIVPGDKLMFVNDEDLSNSTLEHAVAVLKSAPDGLVRLGIAKPVPIEQCGGEIEGHSPIISRSERVLAEGSSPRPYRRRQKQVSSFTSSQETVWLGALEYRRQHPQGYYPSSGSLTPSTPRTYNTSLNGSNLSMTSWSPCSTRSITPCGSPFLHGSWASDVVYLPASLERSIKIQKGALSLGLVLDAEVDRGINGCQVRSICSKKALGRDGRVQVSDFIVKINTENLRNVTNSQARAILKRTNLIGTHCSITYITASDAKLWRERYHQDADYQLPVVNRLSPKIFPKFYRSPYFEGKQMGNAEQQSLLENNLPDSEYSGANGTPPPLVAMHSAAPVIGGKLVEEFSYNFVQTVLKDVWLDLLVSDCWTALSTKEREPSLSERIEIAPSTSAAASKESIHQESSEIWSVDAGFRKDWDSVRNFEKADSGVDRRWGSMSSWSQESLRAEGCGSPKEFIVAETLSPESDVTCTNEVRRQSLIDAGWINPSVSTTAIESFPSSPSSATDVAGSRTKFWSEARTVVLHRKPNQSFGISIVGGRVEVSQKGGQPGMRSTVSGIFIKSVLPNSPAGLSGMMNMGDRVISVNDQDLREATHEQAVQVIKNARNPVKFVVQSLHSFTSYQAAFDTIKSGIEEQNGEMVNISDKIGEIGSEGVKRGSTVLIAENLPVVPVITTETNSIAEVVNDSDAQFRKPIFESYRRESADEEKKLKEKGAVEIEPSEISAKEDEIIKRSPVIQNKEKLISSTVRDLSWKSNVISTGCKYMSDPRLRGVDPDSAAALSKCEDDLEEEDNFFYTKDKIARKYGSLPGNTILLKLDKVPRSGLGLSLAGNRDPAKMNVFVVAVRSTCPLPIKIGDELLEVNGKVLIGLTHLDASAKIRECCEDGILELLLLRRFEALAITSNAETDENKSATKDLQMNISEATALHSVENVRKKSSQSESTVEIETGRETFIEIDKDGKGLGLSIVGGSDTVLGTVVIHEVYSDGAAAVDGRLKPGDQVLEVNGVSLRGVSHEQAILLLRRTPSKVRLLVYRDINLQLSLLDPTQIYNIFEMELTKKPGRGLGLSIVGRKNEPGVYVSEVVKGGAAEADGRLMQGDQILAVNGQDVTSSMQEDVAAKLKACPGRVALKVGRWKLTEAANKAHAATEASLSMSGEQYTDGAPQATKFLPVAENKFQTSDNPVIVKPNDGEAALSSTNLLLSTPAPTSKAVVPQVSEGEENQPPKILHPDLSQPVTEEPGSGANPKSLVKEEETSTCRTPQTKNVDLIKDLREEDSDSLLVMLRKIPDQQLGMGIGKRTRGILVTSLQPGSVAAEKLKVGDRLMAVNGVPITDQLSAVTLVKASGEKLWLQIARPKNFCNP